MGPKLMESNSVPIKFQAVGHGLDKERNLDVRLSTNRGISLGEGEMGRLLVTISKGDRGEIFGQRPTEESKGLKDGTAVEGLIKGLCQEVRHDTKLMEDMSSIRESDDETLEDATSA
ncbi:hypothetical protein Goarm_023342 [Gossypium armourianum]|uniref:Uncharacterized protein n=1 Tax=Gossypium armourianum TaxID=34283 RepID=A0A7J9KIB2_9ROSI|nr:hypothetical protein [Gossypium armourianum]